MIRTASSADIVAIVALWNRVLVRDTITEARFAKWLFTDPDYDVETGEGAWVAEKGGEIVGFIHAIKRYYPNDMNGTEDEDGWIAVFFVAPEHQRQGIGTKLLDKATQFLKQRGVRKIWFCGNTGSAPGYVFPGVDKDAYASGFAFLKKSGFVIDHEPVAMSGSLLDFDVEAHRANAWAEGTTEGIHVEPVRAETIGPFLTFLRRSFPGDWNTAARNKLKSGAWNEILIAWQGERVVGFCQWEGEHFGPFGVSADARSKKIGAKLFVEAARRIREADGRTVWFNWADEGAARFYGRYGLKATRQFAIMRKDV